MKMDTTRLVVCCKPLSGQTGQQTEGGSQPTKVEDQDMVRVVLGHSLSNEIMWFAKSNPVDRNVYYTNRVIH